MFQLYPVRQLWPGLGPHLPGPLGVGPQGTRMQLAPLQIVKETKKNEQIEIHTKISSNILWREIKNWPAPARIAWCGAAKVIPATGPTTDSQGKK